MRKQLNLTLIVFLVFFNGSFAQTNTVGEFNRFIAQNWSGEYIRIGQYKVRGTPYLLGESFPGTLTYKGGVKSDAKILYDLYNQKAGADVKNNILESDQALEEFSISLPAKFGGNTLLFKSTEAYGNTSLKNYFNVLEDGTKVSLLKIFRIKLVSDPSNMMDKEQKIFEQYYEYYLYNKTSKELNKIKLKEKDIAKQLGDDFFLKDLIEKGDLDISKEVDAIKLIQAYNNK
jgi:hypothetical protein